MDEVSEFIVIAPAARMLEVEASEQRLMAYLAGKYPHYTFRLELGGAFQDDDEFVVVPIMNRPPKAGERVEDDQIFMCKPLDPRVIPELCRTIEAFERAGAPH